MRNQLELSKTCVGSDGKLTTVRIPLNTLRRLQLRYFARRHDAWLKKDTPRAKAKQAYFQQKIDTILLDGNLVPRYLFRSSLQEMDYHRYVHDLPFDPKSILLNGRISGIGIYDAQIDVDDGRRYRIKRKGGEYEMYELSGPGFRSARAMLLAGGLEPPFERMRWTDLKCQIGGTVFGLALGIGGYLIPEWSGLPFIAAGNGILILCGLYGIQKPRRIYERQSARIDEIAKEKASMKE